MRISFFTFLSYVATLTSALSLDRIIVASSFAENLQLKRRDVLKVSAWATIVGPQIANAEGDKEESNQGLLTPSQVADLLHPIPTFTIVDKKGVPYMVVGEDAKVTGYFFTTYGEASRLLELAKKSATKAIAQAKKEGQDDIGSNPWLGARISSIPLDSAITLVIKSTSSFGGGNYFRIAPAEEDVEDALTITGQDDLAEGKVPIFYFEDFAIPIDNGETRTPLYFRKSELETAFQRQNPGKEVPKVLVTELLSVLAELVRPGNTDSDLKNLVLMSPKESLVKKKQCNKAGGKEAPFYVGQRIIIL